MVRARMILEPRKRASGHVKLVKRKRGPQWYAKFRLPSGRQLQRCLGPAWTGRGRPPQSYFTERSAEMALEEILVDAEREEIPTHENQDGPSFGDAVEAWLAHREVEKGLKTSTLRDYRNTTASKFIPRIGEEVPVCDVSEEMLANYKAERLEEVSRRTVQKEMVMLHGIFEVARRSKRWISHNPAAELDRVRLIPSGDFNVLEAGQVYEVAAATPSPLDRALITVAAFTGLRLGELRALRWEAVRFDLAALQVSKSYVCGVLGTPKSGRVRTVPLMQDAAAALQELAQHRGNVSPKDLVFPSSNGCYRDDGDIRDAFYEALKSAGLGALREKENPFWFHDLRHTFGTIAVRAWPVPEVQIYMGHAHVTTTMKYVHYQPRHEAAQELTDVVRGIVET